MIKISFVWGIAGLDRSTITDQWDSGDRGDVIWDDTFDITPPESQTRILEICQDLREKYADGKELI